ncbi:shikimate kinase [Candidatus Woesearchaeota archaeon]|nr:shikimate kinase [Candidatus Woesearchaeota archaeon]
MPENIILIGYRGTGKTVVAKQLSKKLNLRLISTDNEIIKKTGLTIPEIITKHGWAYFRKTEADVIKQLAKKTNLIIDCGGGIIEREQNISLLRKKGIIFWLRATLSVIIKRIKHDDQRPSLTGIRSFTEEAEEILLRRTPLYKKAADYDIDTDNKTIEEVADEILEIIKNGN